MRRTALATLLVAAVVLSALPANADVPPVSCDARGRERFTTEGFKVTMPAPAVAAPEGAAPADPTAGRLTPYRSAQFPFVADFAPSQLASVSLDLTWDNPGDFDLYLQDANGELIGVSERWNPEIKVWTEYIRINIEHCALFTIVVRNWVGSPAETLTLEARAEPSADRLMCAQNDPAPNCVGKAAGQAPDPTAPDTRTRLYLGGDPGQVSMVHGYNAGTAAVPFRGTLSTTRPLGGTPNSYTRPVLGFRDQYRNPFVPHFSTSFAQPRELTKAVDALLWISSPTLKDGGTLYVDLYADGSLVSSVQVAGAQVRDAPTPLTVRLPIDPEHATPAVTDLTLQLGTTPAASTNGPGNTADALFTVHYGSTQFPSRLTLQ